VRELAQLLLQAKATPCWWTESAAGTEDFATEHSGKIHLLLTDVMMPGISGRELARKVTERSPKTRVLYMSATRQRDRGRRDAGAELHSCRSRLLRPCGSRRSAKSWTRQLNQSRPN